MNRAEAAKATDQALTRRRSSTSGLIWLIVLLAAVAAIMCYRVFETRVDRELRIAVLKRLAEAFPHARVKIDRVSIVSANKLALHGLCMAASDNGQLRQILAVERLELTGDLDIAHVIQESVAIHRVDIFRPQADLWKLSDGSWSLMALNLRSKPGQATPRVVVHQGDLRLHRGQRDSESPIVIHDINGNCGEGRPIQLVNPHDFVVDGHRQQPRLLEGKFSARSSGTFENLQLEGSLNRVSGRSEISGVLASLAFSDSLINKLPPDLSKLLTQLAGLSCRASARVRIDRRDSQSPWKFNLAGKLTEGRLKDERLPYPLDQLGGDFYCDNQSLKLRDIQAQSGQAMCKLNADIQGFHAQAPVHIQVSAIDLQLDSRLYQALGTKWRTYWDRVQPSGRVNAQVTLKSDGAKWTPHITLQCQDVQVQCWLFPYPLQSVSGQITILQDGVIGRNLRGKAGGQDLRGELRFNRIDQEWYGELQLTGHDSTTIDEKIIQALTVRGQPVSAVERFVRSLEPSGTFHIERATFKRSFGETGDWHKELVINVSECSLLYQAFRYPLHRIRGRIEAHDDQWQLIGFEGWNDSGRIECHGHWREMRNINIPFNLTFIAHTLPMEDELQRALPNDARQLWDQLQPSGSIDRAEVQIARSAGGDDVDIEVALHEDPYDAATAGQSLRLHPRSFPFWLTEVACDLKYRPGHLEISQASAGNASSRVSIRAACHKNKTGNWVGTVKWLPSSRLMIDNQFLRTLPEAISEGLVRLDIRGPVNITGETNFELPIDGVTAPTTDLKLQLDPEEVQLGDGKMVNGLRGSVQLVGHRSPTHFAAAGWANIDALRLRGVPVTNLRGPFALLGNQLYFGSEVASHLPPGDNNRPTEMTAEALAGRISASGSGQLDTGRFQISARLADADFRGMLQELGASNAPSDARCNVELMISGIPWETQTYSGVGAIQLRDAELYQLPMMIRLLRALSIAPTDKAAFHTADIGFSIDGDRIPLELKFEGDLLSLRGSGYTNFRKELNLELYSYVGGRVPVSSVLTPLIAETPYASFTYIPVTGTIDNPQIGKRAIPQLAAFQQIFPDKIDTATENSNKLLDRLRR